MGNITTIGLDPAKNVFQVHAVDETGSVVMRKHLSDVEESLNFDRYARDPLDLRSVYAPTPRA